jgi:exonuclease VII large subunit
MLRGYAIVRKNGRAVISIRELALKDKASIQLQDGVAVTRVEDVQVS